MNRYDYTLQGFARLLESECVRGDAAPSFRDLCRRLGVSHLRFNRFLSAELGFRGEEILSIYRQSARKKS